MFGIENGLCEKSIFFSSSFHSYIGKSTIQHSSNRSLVDKLELFANLGARGPGELDEVLRLAGDEEARRRRLRARVAARIASVALDADVLGERAGAALFAFAPENIAEARLAFALRPSFMRSQNARLPPRRRRDRPHRRVGALQNVARKS